MCSKPPGVDLYNWSAVRVFVGEHGGSRCGSSPPSHDEVLLAAVAGDAARIVRVNPRDGSEATELDLPQDPQVSPDRRGSRNCA
ncbi:MAG: hypothetical protein WCB44_14520 [Stellaceae bacterium]